MKQKITIAVIPGDAGQELFDRAEELLFQESLADHFEKLIAADGLLYFSEHLDLWSMWDSFDRLMRPKSRIKFREFKASSFYAIRRDLLRIRVEPRGEEERLLWTLLDTARTIYSKSNAKAHLFVVREVLGVSPD